MKDIKSRLLELPKANISLPSDKLLKGLIVKLLKDKGVVITSKLLEYTINRIERSYEAVNIFCSGFK